MTLHLLIGVLLGAAAAAPAAWFLARLARRGAAEPARPPEGERLAFLGQLAGGLAHEIKNPLSTLSLNLQLLAEDCGDDGPRPQRMLRRIDLLRREAERLTGVLDDFLRFARGHDLQLVEADLNAVIEEVLDFFDPEAQQRRVILRRFLSAAPPVLVDVDRLKQAVYNILLNAQQALSDGGEVIVRTGRNGTGALIEITDTGVGIAPEDLDRIFKPFFSTKRGGTGLGLSLARRIIEEHGGALGVESEPGKGTRFSIVLPAGPGAAPGKAP